MPRYIDADALLTDEMTHTLPVGCGRASGRVVVFVDDIEKAKTADVVSRAEVERLQSAYTEQNKSLAKYIQPSADLVSHAKAEVARGIFDDIERLLFANKIGTILGIYYRMELKYCIEELKKKYTEEQ